MCIQVNNIHANNMEEYEVNQFVSDGFMYLDITYGMYGLHSRASLQKMIEKGSKHLVFR